MLLDTPSAATDTPSAATDTVEYAAPEVRLLSAPTLSVVPLTLKALHTHLLL